MTEEQDFWINKDDVSTLSNAEGTVYKVTRKTMNRKGWHKLASNEQIVKKVCLDWEDADWFEKHISLPFYDSEGYEYYLHALFDYVKKFVSIEAKEYCIEALIKAYFCGYVTKERKYYIRLNFDGDGEGDYLAISEDGEWFFSDFDYANEKTQFTQAEIDEMQKDPRAKGLDLNTLKVEVPEDELED